METSWECIVVGGGAAGLSAALVLGRARRRTLVVDKGEPSNAPAHGIGGLLGFDGRPPAEFYAAGRRELAGYPAVEVRAGEVVGGRRADAGFVLDLADGGRERTRRVLLATGMDYRPPQVAGVAERWGRSVFHCPFCHGWEVRDRPLGVLDRGAAAVHRALLLRAWSDDVTLFPNGPSELDDAERAQLDGAGVEVDERRICSLRGPGDDLTHIVFTDGSARPCGGLLTAVTLHQRSTLAEKLGAVAAPANPLVVDGLQVDGQCTTTAAGVFAAGDLSGQMQSVANAVAAGSNAAAMVVRSLVDDDHGAG